jgi:hypothetical protein
MTRTNLQLTIVMKLRKNTKDKDRPKEVQSYESRRMILTQLMLVPNLMLMKAKCYKRKKKNSWVVMTMILENLVSLTMMKKLTFQISKWENLNKKSKKLRRRFKQFSVD